MPLVQTRGAASAQGFGEFAQAAAVPIYIEDVFSTWLYTGTGAAQTVTNGIDLSTKGGLVWVKDRSQAYSHTLVDTARGISSGLSTDTTGAAGGSAGFTSFDTTGFSFGSGFGVRNNSGDNYASWTFREQPKFFDVVTWSGDDASKVLSHNLGSVPGSIFVKSLVGTGDWKVWHRSLTAGNYLRLNTTAAQSSAGAQTVFGNNTITVDPTSTQFTVGSNICAAGDNYVAYLFAHDAGGFGLTGTDNVISCGSYTTNASAVGSVTLGYEPQWVIVKNSTAAGEWYLLDNMRGWSMTQGNTLRPNSAGAESADFPGVFYPTATGFVDAGTIAANANIIYIAIRRGPMKVPTLGTTVFAPATRTGNGTNTTITSSTYPVDMTWIRQTNNGTGYSFMDFDRLRGPLKLLYTNNTQSENNTSATVTGFDVQNGYYLGNDASGYGTNVSGQPIVYYNLKRAPSFFDEVCYTGDGTDPQTVAHNLGKAPELMIFKARNAGAGWRVWGGNMAITEYLALNENSAVVTGPTFFGSTLPTATSFYVGSGLSVSARTHVAYLFATCAGVSKVGSYTGNGTTQTINCGFTGGARFVLIKRTDSTGDWYVYDTARGMTVLTDPYLLLNDAAGEVATLGSVTTVSTGFALNSAILAAINVSAGTYIFFAVS